MKFITSNCSIGYPVYGAKFLNNRMLLVAGGGGEGSNGIPNKLTVLRIDFSKKRIIKRFREITLDPNDDSPTTLDVASNTILMGCNENSEKIKKGEGNHHLRKFLFENEHLKFVASIDFDRSKHPDDYTKLIYLSRDGSVGAIASSAIPTVIRIIDPKELTEKYEIETGHEVKDMHFAPDGKVIGYITASTLEVISIVTGRFIIRKTNFDENYLLSKIKFLTDDVILIAASLKKGSGIVMIKISLRSGSAAVLKNKVLTNRFKGVTAMDVDNKNELVILAGSDNSLVLVKLKDLSLGRIFKRVHNFAITRVSFSPDSCLIASVSAANTIHVIKVPDGFAQSTSIWSKLWKLLLNFVLVALVAFLVQTSLKYDLHNKLAKFLEEWYEERHNKSIVKREDSEQVTLVGAVSNAVPLVFPTYPISSDLALSANASKGSIANMLRNSNVPEMTVVDQTTTQSVDSLISSSGLAFLSTQVSLDNTILRSGVPGTTKHISITITEMPTRISEQTAVRSLSHHGPTPKLGDLSNTTVEFANEIPDGSVEPELSKTIHGKSPGISSVSSSSSATITSHSVVAHEEHFSSTTCRDSSLTTSAPSIEVATSNLEAVISHLEETRDSSTSYQQLNVPISESRFTASSKTTEIPISRSQDGHGEDSVLVTTKADSGLGVKWDRKTNFNTSLKSLSPSTSLPKVGVTDDIVVDTANSNKGSSTYFSDKPLSVSSKSGSPYISSLFLETNGVSNSIKSATTVLKISRSEVANSSTNVKSPNSVKIRSDLLPYVEITTTDASIQKEIRNISDLVAGSIVNRTSLSRNSDVVSLPFSGIDSQEIIPESGEQLSTRSEHLQMHSTPSEKNGSLKRTMNFFTSTATSSHISNIDEDQTQLSLKANGATGNIDLNVEEILKEDGYLIEEADSNVEKQN